MEDGEHGPDLCGFAREIAVCCRELANLIEGVQLVLNLVGRTQRDKHVPSELPVAVQPGSFDNVETNRVRGTNDLVAYAASFGGIERVDHFANPRTERASPFPDEKLSVVAHFPPGSRAQNIHQTWSRPSPKQRADHRIIRELQTATDLLVS
jgi:hypothetical protein